MKEHKKSKHEGVRYPCDQCEYAATQVSNLIQHKKTIHEGIRYPCDQCEYKGTQYSSLKSHKKIMHRTVDSVKQNNSRSQFKAFIVEPVFIETSLISEPGSDIKKEKEDPLSGTNLNTTFTNDSLML